MRVYHSSLDIIRVSVVLESSLEKARLLAQLSNMSTVVVCEHLVAQDRICHLNKDMSHAWSNK